VRLYTALDLHYYVIQLGRFLGLGMILLRTYNKLVVGIVLCLLLPTCVLADKLEDVVKKAVASNPAILMQSARRYAQDSKVCESVSGYMPQVDLSAAYGRDHNRNYFTRLTNPSTGQLSLTRRETAFSVRQMIFDGFAVRSEVEADTARMQSSSYGVLSKVEEVILQTTAAYIDTIMIRSIFMHAKENLIKHQMLVEQLTGGDVSTPQRGDLELAKSRLSLAQTIVLDLQRDIRDSQANYVRVVGSAPGVMFRPDAPDKKLPSSEDAVVAVALANNPLVQSMQAEIRAARADKRQAKAGFFPRFELEVAGTNNNNVDGINQHTNSVSAMLQMKYNLFRGGKDVANERKFSWLLEEKKQQLNDTLRMLEQNARHSWSAYVNYAGQLTHLKERVDAMQVSRDSFYKEFVDGERDLGELLDAENELYLAKANYVHGQYKELLSRFMILQSMGKIKEYFKVSTPKSVAFTSSAWENGY
jgi:adhesin transport system outer membrane protein